MAAPLPRPERSPEAGLSPAHETGPRLALFRDLPKGPNSRPSRLLAAPVGAALGLALLAVLSAGASATPTATPSEDGPASADGTRKEGGTRPVRMERPARMCLPRPRASLRLRRRPLLPPGKVVNQSLGRSFSRNWTTNGRKHLQRVTRSCWGRCRRWVLLQRCAIGRYWLRWLSLG